MDNTDHRQAIIRKAREKYIKTGITKNLSCALALYLETDATTGEQIPLRITTPERHQVRQQLNKYRPECHSCGNPLRLKINAVDPAGQAWPSSLVCTQCGLEYFSDLTLSDWKTVLQDGKFTFDQ